MLETIKFDTFNRSLIHDTSSDVRQVMMNVVGQSKVTAEGSNFEQ